VTSLRDSLPEVYRPLLPAFFDTPAPHEEKATCDSCAMCAPPGTPPSDAVTYFRPDAKCCTFHPLLPNYLVGAILADERPDMQEGKRRIQARIAARTGVSPRWLAPSRKTDMLQRGSQRHAFGRSLVLLCPYFERTQSNCTIWRHRESVCSTFYCKYNAGADGQEFWRSLRRYAVWVEGALAAKAASFVKPGHQEPAPLSGHITLEELEDRAPAESDYAPLWGEWAGREEDFYLRCFAWVRDLGREGFEQLAAHADHDARLRDLTDAHETMLHPKLPERLVPHPELRSAEVEDGVIVSSYSKFEPLKLTRELFEVVRMFGQGGTVAEVRARILKEHEVEVPEELLASLHQFRVLVDPTAPLPGATVPVATVPGSTS